MSSKTKIVVLRMKEIIYTAVFLILGILLVSLFLFMFRPGRGDTPASSGSAESIYIPGVYTSSIRLGNEQVNVQVSVDADHINAIDLVPLSESVTTMYPLMQPALDDLAEQICASQSTENISYASEARYTSQALLKAINDALQKAEK
ncbi:MAG TPA: hypothetical protein IAA17_00190 [Candidatus Lachnoclostridium stercorigallinarum]|uniref:FMN-binding domain-containing protein n=1 Tax=Candidatus Lachnoclostridium stercorigallinarum TaxID=2838634 RepID=A0A9D2GFY7_9FIRM|nr:hypothetical protein [Candidatus Lachnoclostridium stercorigallinarum]